ncbi:MAG TPA: hypothetical protein VLA29_08035 [Acidimicrobiia bacterium]|nr:hypothetical protein [Acidimicrobiia bacterium]
MTTATWFAVSRLAWSETMSLVGRIVGDGTVSEVPHVAGHPVDALVPKGSRRVREWPNRLGVCEEGVEADIVMWYGDLAPAPSVGDVHPVKASVQADHEERRRWLDHLLRQLEQHRGVVPAGGALAPCGVVLTPGIPRDRLLTFSDEWPSADPVLPTHLIELPGGIQLAVTDEVWERRDQYAEDIVELVRRGV